MIEIALEKDHDEELQEHRCFSCGNKMVYTTTSNVYTYKRRQVRASNIYCYRCLTCGEELYSARVVDKILRAVRDVVRKENES